MIGGACKESFLTFVECPDKEKSDKKMTMLECMEATLITIISMSAEISPF